MDGTIQKRRAGKKKASLLLTVQILSFLFNERPSCFLLKLQAFVLGLKEGQGRYVA